MDTLKSLFEELKNGPTIIESETETDYFIRLQRFSKPEIFAASETFQQILGELMNSHMDNFYAIDEHNISSFINFSNWLRELATQTNEKNALILNSYADDFALNPKDY